MPLVNQVRIGKYINFKIILSKAIIRKIIFCYSLPNYRISFKVNWATQVSILEFFCTAFYMTYNGSIYTRAN